MPEDAKHIGGRATRSVACALLLALLGCAGAPKPAPPPPAADLGLRESYEPAPEFGGTVHVLEAGPAHAPTIVLIHGFGAHAARDFDPIVPALSRDHHVFMFDLPGFGGSSSDAREVYKPARYVRFAHELIERHFDHPVGLLGHSMGGALAIALAGRYPNQFSRVALLDVAGILYYRDYLLNLMSDPDEAGADKNLLEGLWSDARESLLRIALSTTALEELQLEEREAIPSYLSPTGAAALMFVGHDFSGELHRVSQPTWIGWGAQDNVAPERTAQLLRFMLRPVQFETFAESGHVPMQTEPERLAHSLLEFFGRRALHHDHDERSDKTIPAPQNAREGSCVGQRDRLFEGDYDRIVLHDCKRVLVRNVRTRSLWVERSSVELEHVEVTAEKTAATFVRSKVHWTGGQLRGASCVESDASEVNLAGVNCTALEEPLQLRDPGAWTASVSWFEGPEGVRRFHGKYQLDRTVAGETPMLSADALAAWRQNPSHSTPRFDLESWAGRRLVGQDLVGAALAGAHFEGTNLSRSDLSAADLRGAHMRRSSLRQAKLRGADLRGAKLMSVRAQRSDLRLADLRDADCEGADLRGADLRGAKLQGAKLAGTRLKGAIYDPETNFPADFDPNRRGLVLKRARAATEAEWRAVADDR